MDKHVVLRSPIRHIRESLKLSEELFCDMFSVSVDGLRKVESGEARFSSNVMSKFLEIGLARDKRELKRIADEQQMYMNSCQRIETFKAELKSRKINLNEDDELYAEFLAVQESAEAYEE